MVTFITMIMQHFNQRLKLDCLVFFAIALPLLAQCIFSPLDRSLAQSEPTPPQTRNPLLWPFAQESIWNMPIGDGAVYTFANVQPSTRRGLTVDEDILILEPDAPLTPIYLNNVAWESSDEGAHGGSGLSSIGGTIRLGELVPGGVIRHALKINPYNAYS